MPQWLQANEFHVILEGSATALGGLGYVLAMEKVCQQMKTLHGEFDRMIIAVDSGGMMGGMLCCKIVYGLKT